MRSPAGHGGIIPSQTSGTAHPVGSHIHISPNRCLTPPKRWTRRAVRSATLKPIPLYVGLILTLGGATAFLIGACSSRWVEINTEKVPINDFNLHRREKMLSHFGPWRACNNEEHCDHPWDVAPGLDKPSVRGTQVMLGAAMLTYVAGGAVVTLQLARLPATDRICRWMSKENLAESIMPVAAVLGFLSMLMVGELKRKVILNHGQQSSPGWAFTVCLAAIISSVIGTICTVLYPTIRLTGEKAKGRVNTLLGMLKGRSRWSEYHHRRGISFVTLKEQDIHLAVVSTGATHHGGSEDGPGPTTKSAPDEDSGDAHAVDNYIDSNTVPSVFNKVANKSVLEVEAGQDSNFGDC